ncbi:hypothetical protein TD95_005373 [Thielaviopsis punctulata]|uniref:Uncharacterized protein n=1 Tax=Thielaviopsis punctulata TaxID=72032 RepID=A0A0F4ZHW1_9PEZI|nr:hypothetical protein TD95_005373 [Thielaviopsis punctulata]
MAVDKIVSDPGLSATLSTSNKAQLTAQQLTDLLDASLVSPNDLTHERQMQLAAKYQELDCELSQLRLLNRSAVMSARNTKAQTAEARQEIDRLHLQLQNLYYEQRHLQGEIEACNSYDHSYQKLPLISEEEFFALFPELKDADEDAIMVARIEHERSEREALEQQRQELLKRKQKLISDNKKRANDLANLDTNLEKFIDAAKPIQKLFENVV